MVRKKLSEVLQTNRYRLLYFIYQKRRIKSYPGIKSELRKVFGYRSDGHFYPDWEYLFNENLLVEKDGYIRITRKGRQEFILLASLRNATYVSIAMGSLLFYFYGLLLTGWQPPPYILILCAFLLLASGVLFEHTRRNFVPSIPDEAEEFSKL